ncbi:MAG: bifunctional DNA-formamidopyrimidine glycosylase/DNA-(apurinic or apyrimidinic site) lyase [Deltaproteobacteria bacterium]|nr:MAG: bifunctional DNA-formamidopyrimidine glycosylase/DNA-(apurinic or apyrimidinic site) lyase [Deltaproteobacteria bacterium]
MPELPEVETTRLGLRPHLLGRRVEGLTVRQDRLRWPVPPGLNKLLVGARLADVTRRAKYLLFRFDRGTLLVHLGMSGSLRLVDPNVRPGRHDHIDIDFSSRILRLNDPRRFGAVVWAGADPEGHPLLKDLGVEPLGSGLTGAWLHRRVTKSRRAVKNLVMDQKIIVGVGNIYACEALFRAGLHPGRPAGELTRRDCHSLVEAIRAVLEAAITAGGTTLKDFTDADGRPGYFARELAVYGRAGEPCPVCSRPIEITRLGNRSTYFCAACQR